MTPIPISQFGIMLTANLDDEDLMCSIADPLVDVELPAGQTITDVELEELMTEVARMVMTHLAKKFPNASLGVDYGFNEDDE